MSWPCEWGSSRTWWHEEETKEFVIITISVSEIQIFADSPKAHSEQLLEWLIAVHRLKNSYGWQKNDYGILNQHRAFLKVTQDVTRKCNFQRFLSRIRVLKTTLPLNSISLIKLWPSERFETSVSCVSFRSDPITCARSQHGVCFDLDLSGQPLWGQHWLAAAYDTESQGGTIAQAHTHT